MGRGNARTVRARRHRTSAFVFHRLHSATISRGTARWWWWWRLVSSSSSSPSPSSIRNIQFSSNSSSNSSSSSSSYFGNRLGEWGGVDNQKTLVYTLIGLPFSLSPRPLLLRRRRRRRLYLVRTACPFDIIILIGDDHRAMLICHRYGNCLVMILSPFWLN